MKKAERKGIWFYGLSGAGKTYASMIAAETIQKSFVIDGDDVRKYVSTDLGYTALARATQVKRVLGLSKISINNKCFPIISTVTMNAPTFEECKSLNIEIVQISRSREQLMEVRDLYWNSSNVVGDDIEFQTYNTISIFNCGTKNFRRNVIAFINET